jgi:RNA polymerase sigma factor (TIGR02999 family)
MSAEGAPEAPLGRITTLLHAWSEGREGAFDELMPLVYAELRSIAGRQARAEPLGSTLTPTAVVHELYLRLVRQDRARWENRRQFFAVTARLIRRILVDHARERGAEKRAGGAIRVELTEDLAIEAPADVELLGLDRALERLATLDPRATEVVGMHYFLGFSVDEIADLMELSTPTIKRDLRSARAFLQRELAP